MTTPEGVASTDAGDQAESKSLLTTALATENLTTLAKRLYASGYRELSDLGEDQATVEKQIRKAAPDTPDGEVARAVKLWKADSEKSTPPTTPDSVQAPKLPEGTKVDLSQNSVIIEDITFRIPTELQTRPSGGTPRNAMDLTPSEWMVLAKRTRLTYGIHLDKALASTGDEDALAMKPALDWLVNTAEDFVDARAEGAAASSMCYTSQLSNLVHNRLTKGALSVSAPFVGGAASAERNETQASSMARKSLFMTGVWRYMYATLDISKCTVVSERLVEDIRKAMAASEKERFDALRNVFNDYGHVVPSHVELGGQLYFQSKREAKATLSEIMVTTIVNTAVDAKFKGVTAGASASFEDADGVKVDAQSIQESVSFTAVGGDITLASAPADWASTTKDPNSWAVIKRDSVVSIVERLKELEDAELYRDVKSVWDEGLKAQWGGATPPSGFVYPDMEGNPFTISRLEPDAGVLSPFALSDSRREWTGIPNVPMVLAPLNLLINPLPNGLGWVLEYAGKTNGEGLPVYWIIEYADAAQYAARQWTTSQLTEYLGQLQSGDQTRIHMGLSLVASDAHPVPRLALGGKLVGGHWFALCLDFADPQLKFPPESSPLAWTLIPANASGDSSRREYQIIHVISGKALGRVEVGEGTSWVGMAEVTPSSEVPVPTWVCQTQRP